MDELDKQAWRGLVGFEAVLAALIFVPAWSLAYWQGWLYWAVFSLSIAAITVYALRHDRALARRRMNAGPMAEKRRQQKIIQTFTSVLICVVIVTSALDHRLAWAPAPWPLVLCGDGLVLLGFAVMFAAFRANSYASSIIETGPNQPVIDSGPYAWVRHPMYSGALLLFFGTPIALGSWWGLVPAALLALAIVWRLVDEEAVLTQALPGYAAYCHKVRTRLVPSVW